MTDKNYVQSDENKLFLFGIKNTIFEKNYKNKSEIYTDNTYSLKSIIITFLLWHNQILTIWKII